MKTIETKRTFETNFQEWINNFLSNYCLNTCKETCCRGLIRIDDGYKELFETFKLTGEKVPIRPQNSKFKGPHLHKDKLEKKWYFEGEECPNYDEKTKNCLAHNKHPMCSLYPLINMGNKVYFLSSGCKIYEMYRDEEPLKDLVALCKKHKVSLYGHGRERNGWDLTGLAYKQ